MAGSVGYIHTNELLKISGAAGNIPLLKNIMGTSTLFLKLLYALMIK